MKSISCRVTSLLIAFICFADAARNPGSFLYRETSHFRNFKQGLRGQSNANLKGEIEPRDLSSYALPTDFDLTHQLLVLEPFFGETSNFTFNGYTELSLDCLADTTSITVHERDLNIDQASVVVEEADGTPITVSTVSTDLQNEFYIIGVSSTLVAGNSYVLKMSYTGPLNNFYTGFWYGYHEENGTNIYHVMSDFEPIDARNSYPSFDETIHKTSFTIHLIREAGLMSASNMPLNTSVDLGDGRFRDEYQTSVVQATYLTAYFVGDYQTESTTDSGIDYEFYFRKTLDPSVADYAKFVAPAETNHFAAKFQTDYPMPKQGMIGLNQLNSGAMENWGLITYQDYYLLWDGVYSTINDKRLICQVVSHELAHMWFGNIVNSRYWSHLWLQEGFANYYEHDGCGAVEPDFEIWEIYVNYDLHWIFERDDDDDSNPMVYELFDLSDTYGMFNSVTYSKGGSVIRMMIKTFTESTFDAALKTYLDTYYFGTAVQDELFTILDAQAKTDGTLAPILDVTDIMNTWTLQVGYPLVTVDTTALDGTVQVTQERYFWNQSLSDSTTWFIPLTYTSQANPDFSQFNVDWMTASQTQTTISGFPTTGWIIFNIQQAGYYRVNYDQGNWDLLASQLDIDHTIIHVLNRQQLIDDAFGLANSDVIGYGTPFAITNYLSNELSYGPIDAAFEEFGFIDGMMRWDSSYGLYKDHVLVPVEAIFGRVGLTDTSADPYRDQLIRELISDWACYYDVPTCVTPARSLYNQWMASPSDYTIMGANVRYAVYCTAIAKGGDPEWDFAYNRYSNTEAVDEKFRLLYAMGCSQESYILNSYLDMAFNATSGIPQSSVSYVIDAVSEGKLGEGVAWDYVRNNDFAIEAYTGDAEDVANYANIISRRFNTPVRLSELEAFKTQFMTNFPGAPTSEIDEAIADTNKNILWMNNNLDEIVQWLTPAS